MRYLLICLLLLVPSTTFAISASTRVCEGVTVQLLNDPVTKRMVMYIPDVNYFLGLNVEVQMIPTGGQKPAVLFVFQDYFSGLVFKLFVYSNTYALVKMPDRVLECISETTE